MYFEIVGEVTHVETFATGSSIRELARLRKFLAVAGGASERESPGYACPTARFG
jgi:hypothetical protein